MRTTVPFTLLLTVALAAPAFAQEPSDITDPVAQQHLTAGIKDYNTFNYAAAAKEFEAGYQVQPAPEFMFLTGQALRMGGDCAHAILAYHQFLLSNPTGGLKEKAEHGIADCQAKKPPAPSPAPAPSTHTATPPPGAEPAPSPAPTPTPTPWAHDVLGLSLLGAGVVGVAVGAGLFFYGTHEANAALSQPLGQFESQRTGGLQLRRLGEVTLIGGGLVAGGGVARLLLVRSHQSEPADRSVSLDVSPTGFCVTGTF